MRFPIANRVPAFGFTGLAAFIAVSTVLGSGIMARAYAALPKNVTFVNAFEGLAKFSKPVFFAEMPGKTGTYVVLEQHNGDVIVVTKSNSTWVKSVMISVDVATSNEMGLLGFAFHPDFATNRKYYLSYNPNGTTSRIEERVVDATFIKDSGTQPRVILSLAQPYSNHNGGTIAFHPTDRFLYLGFGDGGSGGDPDGNGQKKNALLGKMLRIDVDKTANGKAYAIPSDNPFVAQSDFAPEVWAWGLRNPWKWSFDPLQGDLWVGDVGQNRIEEVAIVKKGENHGWNRLEGSECFNTANANQPLANCDKTGMVLPILEYGRSQGNCVIGGYVYRGNPNSPFYGAYFYADNGPTKEVHAVTVSGGSVTENYRLPDLPQAPTSFGTDLIGNLYITGDGGTVYLLDSPDLKPSGSPVRPLQNKKAMGCCFNKVGSRWLAKSHSSAQAPEAIEVLGLDGSLKQSFDAQTLATGMAFDIQPGLYLVRSRFKGENQSMTFFFN